MNTQTIGGMIVGTSIQTRTEPANGRPVNSYVKMLYTKNPEFLEKRAATDTDITRIQADPKHWNDGDDGYNLWVRQITEDVREEVMEWL